MDITALKGIIQAALASQPFTVSGAQLQSPPVTAVLTGLFGGDGLVLTDATQLQQSDTEVVVEGTTSGVLGLTGQHATVTFTLLDAVAQLHLTLDRLPDGWAPSASFPALTGSVFDDFTYTDPVLRLDSTGAPELPAGYPATFGYPDYSAAMKAAMTPGLSLSATITPSAEAGPLEWLLSGSSSWAVSGPIVTPQDQLSMVLSTSPQEGLAIGGFTIPFTLSLAAVAIQSKPGDSSQATFVTSTMRLDAEVERDVGGDVPLKIPLVARVASSTEPTLTVFSQPPPGQGLTLAQIATLIGVTSLDGQIPDGFPALDDIQLEEVKLVLTPGAGRPLTAVSVTIGWVSPQPYPVFGGLITFQDMAVTFTYLPDGFPLPNGSAGYVTTCGTASGVLAGGSLDAEILLPDLTFLCRLQPGTTIDITELVDHAVGSSIDMPQIGCSVLNLSGNVTAGQYRFQATVTDDWTFDLGHQPLALTQISMDLSKSPSGFGGQIACRFDIAGAELYGSAGYDATTQGWSFDVGTLLPVSIDLTDLADDILALLGLTLPDHTPALILTAVSFSFDTTTHTFEFRCATSLTIAATTVETGLWVTNDTFQGLLWVGQSYFEIDFADTDQRSTLSATWCATTEQDELEFADIAQALALPPPQLPAGLDLALQGATLTYEWGSGTSVLTIEADSATYGKAIFLADAATGTTRWFAGLAVGQSVELSDLPLLDKLLSPGQCASITDLRIVLSSADIDAATAATLNQGIADGYPTLPVTGAASMLGFAATVQFGDTTIPISLGMGDVTQGGGQSNPGNTIVGSQSGGTPVPTTAAAASDGTTWFQVQKSFGPLRLDKVGARYSQGVLWFSIAGSLSTGGLTITLQGASIGSPITSFQPQFDLQGLGIDFANAPLQIGGGFMKVPPTGGATFEYDGTLIVTSTGWGVTAYGSYAELDGAPSMFAFLQYQGTFGGPPAFLVTGIVGGFGYNSTLRIPGQNEVSTCPLVAGLSDPAAVGGQGATPVGALAALTGGSNPWVSHSLGQTWIAAGLTFTTYELLHSAALLVAEFGTELTIALLGMSTARFPPETASPAYATVQLQLEALFQPARGFFGITADLTRNSFLLDPACVLTGGFAFYVWFDPSNQSGDFVVTLGGYHPAFDPPSYYPDEPRLGFTWSLDSAVRVNGSAYLALTPSAIMAGGALSVTFQDGNLKAWLTAWADFLIQWRPFHFQTTIGVSIGVSYRMTMLGTSVTLSVELGADLTLCGPPTRGVAHVHWWVISFTVTFGAALSAQPGPLQTWQDFAPLLPPATDVVKLTAITGLSAATGQIGSADGDASWLVRGAAFSFTARSAIPATELYTGSSSQSPLYTGDKLDIRPMQLTGLTSTQRLSMTLDGTEQDLLADGWSIQPLTAGVPKALWGQGDGTSLEQGDDQLVTGQYVGLTLQAPTPELGWTGGQIDIAAGLGFDPLSPSGSTPIAASDPPTGDIPVTGANVVEQIEDGLTGSGSTGREALFNALTALNAQPAANDPLNAYAAAVKNLFTHEPLTTTGAP
ncbi:DUF6603 domain-containing protein [Nonomuraea guangzhouensis]|uniref:DUF6603 domain-containing protein n=1 Tax=Nonomuraea guangzhouensis TaxID=1291555 RepID=A0ABW4G7U6_9ACTN|nr:DUF6603 domain-containing protein [Nonomuraea guangzhouensis]